MTERSSATLDVEVGDTLPQLVVGPISRLDLALYAGPSGDFNPIHVDIDFAKKAGMDDVFAHGMLSMAYLGRLLSNWARPEQIKEYQVRFQSITPIHATVKCSGLVKEIDGINGGKFARLALKTEIDDGSVTLSGSALVELL